MKLLLFGDVVGELGRRALTEYLPRLRQKLSPDVIVVNGENAADNGRGITRAIVRKWFDHGVDAITLGNHTWAKSEIFDFIDEEPRLIRPFNFPANTPGNGYTLIKTPVGTIAVVSLLGRVFMSQFVDCPFEAMDRILTDLPDKAMILVDIHAETTSEKQALAWHLDGRVSAVIGTHTHVQTADERILPAGTAYLTDVGMIGPCDGVIGMQREAVIQRFRTQLPVRYEVATGSRQLHAVYLEIDQFSKRAKKITRIKIDDQHPFMD